MSKEDREGRRQRNIRPHLSVRPYTKPLEESITTSTELEVTIPCDMVFGRSCYLPLMAGPTSTLQAESGSRPYDLVRPNNDHLSSGSDASAICLLINVLLSRRWRTPILPDNGCRASESFCLVSAIAGIACGRTPITGGTLQGCISRCHW